MRLLYYANKSRVKTDSGWDFPEWFPVPQARLMEDMGIKERHKLYKIQDELILSGSIDVSKSKGRDTQYRLLTLPVEVKASGNPKPKAKSGGSFNTDDFFSAAVMRSFGDDFDPEIIKN